MHAMLSLVEIYLIISKALLIYRMANRLITVKTENVYRPIKPIYAAYIGLIGR